MVSGSANTLTAQIYINSVSSGDQSTLSVDLTSLIDDERAY